MRNGGAGEEEEGNRTPDDADDATCGTPRVRDERARARAAVATTTNSPPHLVERVAARARRVLEQRAELGRERAQLLDL